MADYVEILDTQIEPDAPLTAQLGAQFRDNPIAISEGHDDAPRVQHAGIQPDFIDNIFGASTSGGAGVPVEVLNIDPKSTVRIDTYLKRNQTVGVFAEVSISNDGGVSWSGWKAISVITAGSDWGRGSSSVYLNMATGDINGINDYYAPNTTQLSLPTTINETIGKNNANALRIRANGNATFASLISYAGRGKA